MNSSDDREQQILRRERELQERELALRLREMEAEIYEREKKEQATPAEQLPLYQTRKHNPPENFFRRCTLHAQVKNWFELAQANNFEGIKLSYDYRQLIGNAIRKHWGIENEVHWTLDVTFNEDQCRIRSFHSPRNFALLRRVALNALNQESTYRRSLRQKSKRAAMDNDYMIAVLSSFCQA